jgi:hypothetical protein
VTGHRVNVTVYLLEGVVKFDLEFARHEEFDVSEIRRNAFMK